ncbi:MAG: hypothetical protein C5B53_09210 [Candidatus Melainabacteria bacterium]|nr:MAG: hypothetical protein C5B53_09210 [Candidatus Melainabacteria bacterium]
MPKLITPRAKGATLSLVATVAVTLVLIGCLFFFLVRMLGGDRQTMNATDAGALGAARNMIAIGLPQAGVAPEFQGLGINVHTGQPDSSANGLMNIFAYNRAAGSTTLIAMNALEENTPTAIDNANTVITSLQTLGDGLNTAIVASGQIGHPSYVAFQNAASSNNINMMGPTSAVNLTSDLTYASVPTGFGGAGGKANVYFNPLTFNGDSFYTNMAPNTQDGSGSVRSTAQPNLMATSYATAPSYVGGQQLLQAYSAINLDPRLSPIFLAAVCPAAKPHLIDSGRFSSAAQRIGYAPANALQGTTVTLETNRSNVALTHVASALVGSLYNEYPVALVHGYVRIHNGPDARIANPALSGIYGSVDGSSNIFNNELYAGPGGGGGMIITNNGAFGTVYSNVGQEFVEWAQYNTSFGLDVLHHDPKLDPTRGQQFGVWYPTTHVSQIYWPYPNQTVHIGSGYNQLASISDMRNITSVIDYNCNTTTIQGDPICSAYLGTFQSNYGSSGTGYPLPSGQTVTNLEALKGEVITAWLRDAQTNIANAANFFNYTWSTNGTEFANDSGSKVYNQDGTGYASPTNSPTIAFGTVASPGQLLDQITTNQVNQGAPTCVDTGVTTGNVSQWSSSNAELGKLFQRCQEILPGVTINQVATLLYRYPIDLGQYQYIYLPPGGTALTISTTPPPFLNGLPEYSQPGSTIPDGNALPLCRDPDFAGAIGNQVDSEVGEFGQNIWGDNNLHDMPFQAFNGTASTYDYAVWRPSSGAHNFLGELSFFNHVAANGVFSAPN